MDSVRVTKLWLICPVCHKANPAGTRLCQHCWGAVIHPDIPVTSEELEEITRRRQAYLKRRKAIKVIAISLASLILSVSVAGFFLYNFTDIIFGPIAGLNSDSRLGEWAMFRHDSGRTGATDSSDILPQGKLKWVFSTGDSIHSSPAVADGTVYVGSKDSKLYALDATTGAKRWEYKTGSWVESSPAVVNGVVYFGSNDGRLYALDADSGEKLWDFPTSYPIVSSPAVTNGIVYLGADDYYIYALDAVKGTKLWDFKAGSLVTSSPVVVNGIVYIGSGGDFSYALQALNGRLRLRFKSLYSVSSSPAVSDGVAYFINSSGYLYAVGANARSWPREHEIKPFWIQLYAFGVPGIPPPPPQSGLLWGVRVGRGVSSSPVVTSDTLYMGSENKLVAIDLQSRQKRWEFKAEGVIRSSPAVVGSTIYVGSEDGRLYAVDAATGEKLWDILIGDKITSSPAVAGGMVYIGSYDGKLYAIE